MTVQNPEEDYPHLASLSHQELVRKRTELVGNASSYAELKEEELLELSAVLALLRRGASGPPKKSKGKPAGDLSAFALE